MNSYIKMWLDILENMNNDNTYKLAWGRAILEIVLQLDQGNTIIQFDEISQKMLKYYWNQLFFFRLKQSSSKTPVIVQITQECIEHYINLKKSNVPVWFDYAEQVLIKDKVFYNNIIAKISSTLKQDVSWRFLNCNSKILNIYQLDRHKKIISFNRREITCLKQYAFVLSQLLNYRWSQLLEKFNNSPRIISKVKGISENKLRRNNLSKFKEILINQMENGEIIDFYTGNVIGEGDVSVDHVIPWSFMYSDDIWNLVITSKSNNSSKNCSVASEKIIHKLEIRNRALENIIMNTAMKEELKIANDNDYVNKFYTSFKYS